MSNKIQMTTDAVPHIVWRWAHNALQHLREQRAALSDEPSSLRRAELSTSIRVLLGQLPLGQRQEALATLRGLLHASSTTGEESPASIEASTPPFTSVVDFVIAMKELPPTDLQELVVKIRDDVILRAAFIDAFGRPSADLPEIQQKNASPILPQERLDKLRELLTSRVGNIDNKFWAFLRLLAEQAKVDLAPRTPLRDRIKSHLAGDPETPLSTVERRLGETEKFISAMLAAVTQAWKTADAESEREISPGAIKEKTALGVLQRTYPLRESAWWSAYETRYQEFSEDARFARFLGVFIRRTMELAQKA